MTLSGKVPPELHLGLGSMPNEVSQGAYLEEKMGLENSLVPLLYFNDKGTHLQVWKGMEKVYVLLN